jgi:sugar lactone lactonase YvrE
MTPWQVALLLSLVAAGTATGQSIVTIAGGPNGDGRLAIFAPLSYPDAVATDSQGNFYFGDFFNSRVRKVNVSTGIITTVAGNGVRGYSGDGQPATTASIDSPVGIAVDRAGNIYVADNRSGTVRKVAADTGIISRFAGSCGICLSSGDGGPATVACLDSVRGLSVDAGENLLIAERLRVRRVMAGTGIIATVAGSGEKGFSRDGSPATQAAFHEVWASVTDGSGNVYVADYGSNRILRVDRVSGLISNVAGSSAAFFSGDGGLAIQATLSGPSGLAIDAAGDLYIADTGNQRIRKLNTSNGTIGTIAGNGSSAEIDGVAATKSGLTGPVSIAFDPAGNLYIADGSGDHVLKVGANNGLIAAVAGQSEYSIGNGTPAAAAIVHPEGIDVDGVGDLLFMQGSSPAVEGSQHFGDLLAASLYRAAGPNKTISAVAGSGVPGFAGDGGPATAAKISAINFRRDASGNIFIADRQNLRVRKVNGSTGFITTVAGNGSSPSTGDGGPATSAGFRDVYDIALDPSGNIYIADQAMVRKVDAQTGLISTVAGNGTSQEFSGDGGPAVAAGLSRFLFGVATDKAGNLYISDAGQDRVRRVSRDDGTISTVAGGGTVPNGDGGPATAASLPGDLGHIAFDEADNLYISGFYRVRRVAAGTGIISTVAGLSVEGLGSPGYSGDGGPATRALLSSGSLTVDSSGNLYISDYDSRRIRAVFACVSVATTGLQQPANGSTSVPLSPRLEWTPAKGAFRYDVYLDTTNPPQKIVAADVAAFIYGPSNLDPLLTYYWKVVAKGDPSCTQFSTSASQVFAFTTTSPAEWYGIHKRQYRDDYVAALGTSRFL